MKQKKNRGISLIVLIVTIVVIIILAASIIINLSRSNIIGNANEAVFRSDVKSLKTELEIYVADKISDTLGKYDRKKLNADESTGKYGQEEIEDKNKDGKTDIYDILNSLEISNLKGKVHIEEGKLVFSKEGLTEEQIKILLKEGLEVEGIPKITEIAYESTLNSIKVNVVISDVSEVEKYKYILDGGKEEESSEATKEYTGLQMETNYVLEVIAVLKDGIQISKKQIITTKSIEGNIEYILSETELTANNVTVELEYEREIPEGYILECRVGEGDWQEYKEKIIITENTTVYGRLYNKESDDAKIESSINISNIDKDYPLEPVIESNYGYPILTEYGIEIDGTTIITYDTREDITNLYSLDNGETWQEYTGSFSIPGAGTVMAKSVKKSGLETVVSKAIGMPTDAVGPEAYDGDEETYNQVSSGTLKLYVDKTMWEKNVNLVMNIAGFLGNDTKNHNYVRFYDETGTILAKYQYGVSTGVLKSHNVILNIPSNTSYIGFVSGSNTALYIRVCEVKVANEPIISSTQYYPKVTEYGVEPGYCMSEILYNVTSIQRLYKIDNGEWLEDKNEAIRVELGKTIYAKGINKDGIETRVISSYTSVSPADAVGPESYDENESTYSQISSGTLKLYVDETMWGKDVNLVMKIAGSTSVYASNHEYVRFFDETGTVLASYQYGTGGGSLQSYNKNLNIPLNTSYIGFVSGSNTAFYIRVCEVKVAN